MVMPFGLVGVPGTFQKLMVREINLVAGLTIF